jgi:type VI secretion system VgrG family protein
MRERWALFESLPLGPDAVEVRTVDGVDELNRLFRFDLTLVRHEVFSVADDVAPLLEQPATLSFEEEGKILGQFHGIVSEAAVDVDGEADFTILHVTLVPRAWLLTQRRGDEIFLGRTVPEIIAEKLERIGLIRDQDFVLSLLERYPNREYVSQHDETDWSFVSRLCEHLGITLFFEHRDRRDVLVLSDTQSSFRPIARPTLPVRQRRHHPAAYAIRTTLRRNSSHTLAHDYNYRTPLVGLREQRPVPTTGASGELVEYGPHAKTADETALVARVRKEELAAQHHVVEGTATELSVRAGGTFVLTGVGLDQELLLTRVAFRFRRPDDGGEVDVAWENRFSAIPVKTTFRPARVTPRPRVQGLANAIVDGIIKGDYAELDEAGRYRLRMMYDRSGRTDLGATHPVRMMQPHAGANYGMHFPLRPGIEVLVAYVNGDPDRPIIVGTAPNPVTSSPVIQQNQTQNVLRTGSNNEMVIEDEHGSERIRIHTPKDNTTLQLGTVEEPEEGALLRTDANISEASRLTNNEATTRKNLLAHTSTALLGRSAVVAAGVASITRACGRGIEEPSSVSLNAVGRDLQWLSTPPEHLAEKGPAPDPDRKDDPKEGTADDPSRGGLWSATGSTVTALGEQSAVDLVRAAAVATDSGLDRAKGRAQGEPLGQPEEPAVILAATRTAAVVGRDVGMVYGDRIASLSSHKTASVMGEQTALLKSPKVVEIAGGTETWVTSAGTLDVQAKLVRVVGGYYPEAEAPPLDDHTSVGVMARRDVRMISVECSIHACAKKNIIGTAHTGDIRLRAAKTISMNAGSIIGNAGLIKTHSSSETNIVSDDVIEINAASTIIIDSSGDVVIMAGGNVNITGPTIYLNGPVHIQGNLTVSGTINGK